MGEVWLEALRRAGGSQADIDQVVAADARGEAIDPLMPLRVLQQGRCAVCDEERYRLLVDHDHATGLVRGLLCNSCNSSEGRDFRAPWFKQYREDPPAAQVGLVVLYGNHYPTSVSPLRQSHAVVPPQVRPSDPYGFDRIDNATAWVDAMLVAATGKLAGPPLSLSPSQVTWQCPNYDRFREMLTDLGYAPIPLGTDQAHWRMALFEAFETVRVWHGPVWVYRARRAFVQLQRSTEDGDDYLMRWAGQ